ncbi:hypothetical protein EFL95_17005 [Nocardioides marmorisolisilvae]|uniref:Uncharacterized protein n=1 Tax=Nocardioides marmorisolisilvae TaxID=1542737 RepID=A0A3N0DQT3_9ACTN|nr:hypothetical protein EFL95_17005 [Nocardioides marmorisolisilvae]
MLGVLGVVVLVGAIVGGAVALGHRDDDPKTTAPIGTAPVADPTPTATPTLTTKPDVEAPNEDCGHGDGLINVFTTEPPPIDPASLAEQRAVIDRIKAKDWSGFRIIGAVPTHLGVFAAVDNYDAAKKALEPEGVRMVSVAADELGDLNGQAVNAIQELLEPAVNDITRATKGVPGYASLALWQDAGAVVVDWKAPIPTEIEALAGVRDDGVTVMIQSVRYSEKETRAAQQRVSDAFEHHRVDAKWTMTDRCQDGSGVVVGIEPDSIGTRKAALETELSDIAGVPVHVVAAGPIAPAVGRLG